MAYASAADMRARFDERSLAEIVADDDTSVDLGDLATDTNMLAALDDASGMVDAAVLTGQQYTTTQLDALTGQSLALLKRLTCTQALIFLKQRRGYIADQDAIDRDQKWVDDMLQRLKRGANVFNVTDNLEASIPSREIVTPRAVERAQLMRDRTHNYFPDRALSRR